ncbi:LysR family transcriptional regulator [Actinacidiphila oryziradicis]|jgi:LysR family hydrogen peroxide-inducible transcriptional activator|uniref:LysR family transcriptional regulator n=1 Tax=Actinacidiphila oryziradicis TaxID=2571141 RepID=A0A4U0SRG8_9ACTN|nr:LysR family transcriptional regulator [Actinacidiphila oryziradicis]MCW2899932.1 LysR family transcriptional regulator [Streptosporangiaceae bacterium]TKA10911.1 LysR family transcriptional regulator [Actinacidiphila oryziradicis]
MALELAWLRTWVEVVDAGGFTRAAEHMHLSQPRVSAHIASLERELGCSLIERRIRPLTLTDDGRALLSRARAVLAAADELVTARQTDRGTISGTVSVASFASGSSEFLPGVITKLWEEHSQIHVAVLDGDVGFIEAALSERRVSVALRPIRPEPHDQAFTMRPLWREPFVMLAPTGHPLLEKSEVDLRDFANQRVITIGNPLANTVVGYEAEVELSVKDMVAPYGTISHQPTTLGAMVRAGHGIGIINYLGAVMIQREGMEMRPIRDLHRYRDVGIWWHSERPLGAAAQAFIRAAIRAPRPEGTTAIPPP